MMNNKYLASRVKELRKRQGISQEVLAESSGISLRTVQRIENEESNPTGDTLQRLSKALNVKPDELIDWQMQEDNGYLVFMSLAALSFIIIPVLGILIPFIMWTSKKDQLKGVNKIGKDLINFEINWVIFLVLLPLVIFILAKIGLVEKLSLFTVAITTVSMYLVNALIIIVSSFRLSIMKGTFYLPIIRFLR